MLFCSRNFEVLTILTIAERFVRVIVEAFVGAGLLTTTEARFVVLDTNVGSFRLISIYYLQRKFGASAKFRLHISYLLSLVLIAPRSTIILYESNLLI
jgi:hypothetical protein